MFSDSAISIQPIFAQWIQNVHAAAAGSTAPNALAGVSEVFNGSVVAVGGKVAAAPMPLGTADFMVCLLYTSPSPRDATLSRMPSSA